MATTPKGCDNSPHSKLRSDLAFVFLSDTITFVKQRIAGRFLAYLAILVGLVASASCSEKPPWSETPLDGSANYFSSVWGSSKDDVFVVGGVRTGSIQHYDGLQWTTMDIPSNTPALIWVFGFSSDDVFVVGERGTFLHYDGKKWEQLDSNTSKVLWGAWGNASDDLWLVGGEVGSGRPVIRHWNGEESIVFELDLESLAPNVHALFKVWGVGSEVFAVGQQGTVVHYDGTAWSPLEVTPTTNQDLIAVWGNSSEEVYVVGGRGTPVLGRGSKNGFSIEGKDSLDALGELSGIGAVVACGDEVLLGDDGGRVASFSPSDADASDLEVVYSAFNPVHAIWSDCTDSTFVVGGIFASPTPPGVLVERSE